VFSLYDDSQKEAVCQLFFDAFKDSEGDAEAKLIEALVLEMLDATPSEDLVVCVAVEAQKVIGCIMFSRLTCEPEWEAFILSPVAVATASQGRGVGRGLIRYGLSLLAEKNVDLVLTYGDPKFYSRVGFQHIDENRIKAPFKLSFPDGWLGQTLFSNDLATIMAQCHCVSALNNEAYW
jgi:predicted N-acetyltransferase YhbS